MWTGLGLNLCAQSATKGPPGLHARAQRATFAGSVDVIVEAVLQAQAQAATTNNEGEVGGGTLQAEAQSATFSGSVDVIASADLGAEAQAATFDGDGEVAGLFTATVDIDPAFNVTLGGTMRLTGTSPVVSLSVTPSSGGSLTYATACPGILVTYTTGGTLGVGVFKVSYDSGATDAHTLVTLPAGGTYDLDGAAAGLRLTFAAGTYVLNDTHECTCQTLVSHEGSSVSYTQATASIQPVYRVATGGNGPYLLFAGAQELVSSSATAYGVFTNSAALTVIMRVANTVADATGTVFSSGNTGQATNRTQRFAQIITGTGRYTSICINDAGTTTTCEWSANGSISTNPETVSYSNPAGGPRSTRVNGTLDPGGTQTFNPGTVTPNQTAIGVRADSGLATTQYSGKVYRIVLFNSELGTTDRQAWEAEVA